MKNVMNIHAESRKEVGKEIAKKLRNQGKIPAIIYGGDREAIPISLLLSDVKSILKMEKGENTILRIHREDIQVDAMLKEIQYDYLSDNIIHVDFLRIDLNKPIEVFIPVVTKGEAIGVKVEDGIFDFINRELKIRCLPAKIPKEIEVDISELHTGHSIKVEEVEVKEDIEFLSDPQTVICSVSAKGMVEEKVIEEEVEEEAEVAEEEAEEKKEAKEKEGKEQKDSKVDKEEKKEESP